MPAPDDFDATLPLAQARTIPSRWYTDPAVAEAERGTVFAHSWQAVGLAEQVRQVGSYLTADVAGEPVLVVRSEDGVLRGFFNVCRHRAAPLLTEPCGTATKLRCRYHGWTYDLAGRLRGTPEFDGVCDFVKADNGLVPLGGVAELGPFVWVHLGPPREPLHEAVAPFADWLDAKSHLADLQFHARREYLVDCNWKVYVDNYLDGGYHVATVHPGLAGVLEMSEYTTEVYASASLQSSPLKPATGDAGATRTGGRASYWWLWPNFMVNHYDGVLDTNLVLPIGASRCRVIFDFSFAVNTPAAFIESSLRVADEVQREDVAVCEQVQRGLGSRSYTTGRFSVRREAAGHHFHMLLARALRQDSSWQ